MNINIRKISRRLALALAASAMMATTAAHAVPVYNITDLGTLGGTFSEGNGINDSGQVTGTARTSGGRNHAFIGDASGAPLTDLGTLGGTESNGEGINASGQVTGGSRITGSFISHAFIGDASGASLTDLGTLGGTDSFGWGINDSGQVTGDSNPFPGALHAFISDATTTHTFTDLGTLGGTSSFGKGINASGQVTGGSEVAIGSPTSHAFIGDASGAPLTDLGTLGGASSFGRGINDSGQVTGSAAITGDLIFHAFTGTSGAPLIDLGTLAGDINSVGFGINNSGQVVGRSGSLVANRAFLWDSGTMFDLNSLIAAADPLNGIFTLDVANGINSFGDIVGTGTNASGATHAFLLTAQRTPAGGGTGGGGSGTIPIETTTPPGGANSVPEPAPLALLGFGLLGLGFMRKRRG